MNIVVIIASPHAGRGNTSRLTELVLQGAREKGAVTETFYLTAKEVGPCVACDKCHVTGSCPIPDRFEEIRSKIMASDGLIIASPNYIFSVSAQLKAFMDRCCGVIHCLAFEGKYGASVVTSGGGDDEPITAYMNKFLTITGIQPLGEVSANMAATMAGNFPEDIREQALELGRTLVKAWQNKESREETEKMRAHFENRMRALVYHQKEAWPFEYDFWRKHRQMKD